MKEEIQKSYFDDWDSDYSSGRVSGDVCHSKQLVLWNTRPEMKLKFTVRLSEIPVRMS